MKRGRIVTSLLLATAMVFSFALQAFADETNSDVITISSEQQAQVMDTVIVMDNSGSMQTTDPVDASTGESIGTEATKMLISSAPLNGSKMGIVSFSAVLSDDEFRTSGLLATDNEETRDELLNIVDRIKENGRSGGTNIPVGLSAAAQMLEASGTDNKAIILITDGENDPPRDTEDPWNNDDILSGLQIDYPIYVIGLSQGVESSSVDSFQNYLELIAGSTERVFMLDDVNDIARTIQEIDAMIYDTGDIIEVPIGTVSLDIPENVSACSVSFVSVENQDITIGSVEDPNGENRANDETVVTDISNTGSISTMTLQNPQQGVWNISVEGEEGDRVRVEWKISIGTGSSTGVTSGSSSTTSNTSGSTMNNHEEGSFPWLLIIVIVALVLIGGTALIYFLMIRKPPAPLPGYMRVKLIQQDGSELVLQDWVELGSFKRRVSLGTLSGFKVLDGVLIDQGDDYNYEITFKGSAPAGVSGLEPGLNTDDTMVLLFEDTQRLEFTYKSFLC